MYIYYIETQKTNHQNTDNVNHFYDTVKKKY